jgi:ABC transporter substrate binding protein
VKRRQFIAGLGAAGAWPLAARAQQTALPVVGFVNAGSDDAVRNVAAFRKGLGETGYVEGQNVTVENHWLEGQFDRVPTLIADLVRRHVAVIAAGTSPVALAAKAATATIPIVFVSATGSSNRQRLGRLRSPGCLAVGIDITACPYCRSGSRADPDCLSGRRSDPKNFSGAALPVAARFVAKNVVVSTHAGGGSPGARNTWIL